MPNTALALSTVPLRDSDGHSTPPQCRHTRCCPNPREPETNNDSASKYARSPFIRPEFCLKAFTDSLFYLEIVKAFVDSLICRDRPFLCSARKQPLLISHAEELIMQFSSQSLTGLGRSSKVHHHQVSASEQRGGLGCCAIAGYLRRIRNGRTHTLHGRFPYRFR